MCTIGAKILRPGQEYLLFKNRDFTREQYDDQIVLTGTAFGALGVATFDQASGADVFSGYAFGFNARLACSTAFEHHAPNEANFDDLAQAIVDHCTTIDEALSCLHDAVKKQPYGGSNLAIATPDEVAVVEVRGTAIAIERSAGALIRSNHHFCMPQPTQLREDSTSLERYEKAASAIASVAGVNDLQALLASHFPGQEYGICQHHGGHTVYSYILHWLEGETTLYVHRGHPCDGVPYTRLPVRIGADNDLSAYPTARKIDTAIAAPH